MNNYISSGNAGISPDAIGGRLSKQLLKVATPTLNLERAILISENQPSNSTRVTRWGRYKALPITDNLLVGMDEGITPVALSLEREEVSVTTNQYGQHIDTTDILHYFSPDFKVSIATQRLGELAAQIKELMKWNTFKASPNKYYANGTQRTDVNTAPGQSILRKAEASLVDQNASFFSEIGLSSTDFNTEAILPSYWAFMNDHLKYAIAAIPGFTNAKDYGHGMKALPNEWGNIGHIRFFTSTLYKPYPSAGGAAAGMRSTDGISADVYPILVVAREAWGGVAFKGKDAMDAWVIMPSHTMADKHAQQGAIGYNYFDANVILNDSWNVVLEVACPVL